MTITLTGDNTNARSAALKKLVTDFVAEHGDIALERHDGDEASYDQLTESVQSLPFLASRKMVVLRSPGTNKQFADNIADLLKELPETTDLVIYEPKLDRRSTYFKTLKSKTDFKDFAQLDERGLAQWLVAEAKASGGNISQSDALFLTGRVGADQQLLQSELTKLLLYDPAITRFTIELLTEPTPQSSIFDLVEAAFSGKPTKALTLYEEQRALKVEPQQIMAMLAWQLHVLAVVVTAGDRSADQIARDAKLSPYVVRKTLPLAKQLNRPRLKALVGQLADYDLRLKRQPLDADEVVQLFLLNLSA